MEQFDALLSDVIDSTLGPQSKNYGYHDFNTANTMNELLVKSLITTGDLCQDRSYDLDFDHQFIETEKYDAKRTYKKFTGYSPGVAVIGDHIVGIENQRHSYKQITYRNYGKANIPTDASLPMISNPDIKDIVDTPSKTKKKDCKYNPFYLFCHIPCKSISFLLLQSYHRFYYSQHQAPCLPPHL